MTNYRPLEGFAVTARERLIAEVGARLDAVTAPNSRERLEQPVEIARLEQDLRTSSRDELVEKMAYLWFNRFTALRYMDIKGYLPVRVVSPKSGGQPEVLAFAARGEFPKELVNPELEERVLGIVSGEIPSPDRLSESYRLLLGGVSKYLSTAFPFLFFRDADYSSLLLPGDLLSPNSLRASFVTVLTEELCESVEVIGWLYQFYVAGKKEEVYKQLAKRKATASDIPPATQIFTPRWMVEFLVDNSVAALWKRNNSTSTINKSRRFLVDGSPDRLNDLSLRDPQDYRILDPACGSGHMLVYAFDVLVEIYLEAGHSLSDIPVRILRFNLSGFEIDERAAELASLALTFKALEYDPDFLSHPEKPKVSVIREVRFSDDEMEYLNSLGGVSETFWRLFEKASERGSLISPMREEIGPAQIAAEGIPADDLVSRELLSRVNRVVDQAKLLTESQHVCVTNPPYLGSKQLNVDLVKWLTSKYTAGKRDLYAAFLLRMPKFVVEGGVVAAMTRNNWMFLSSYKELRRELLEELGAGIIIDPPEGSFRGAGVRICGVVLSKSLSAATTIFIGQPWPESTDFEQELSIRTQADSTHKGRVELSLRDFSDIDGSPMVYWLGPKLVALFKNPSVGASFETRQGLATGDNSRFLRFWWEVAPGSISYDSASRAEASTSGKKWFPYNKGGGQARWFGQHYWVVNWEADGKEIRGFVDGFGKLRSRPQNGSYYFRPSVSWSDIGFDSPTFRYYPTGFLFDVAGMSAFGPSDEESLRLLAYLNSRAVGYLLKSIASGIHFQVGDIARLPLLTNVLKDVGELAAEAVDLARADWNSRETSWGFDGVLQLSRIARSPSLREGLTVLETERQVTRRRLDEIQSELDSRVESAMGINESDLPNELLERDKAENRVDVEDTSSDVMREVLSWFVGTLFGRYSTEDGQPEASPIREGTARKLFDLDADGVVPLMEGGWFEDGADERFRSLIARWYGKASLSENLRTAEGLLGKPISRYFAKDFYADHLDTFKKRPVYWLVTSPKGSFQVLVYVHRLNRDTMTVVRNKYLLVMIERVQAQFNSLDDGQARDKERLRSLLKELLDFDEQVLRNIAQQRMEIVLDDGVAHNYKLFGNALKPVKELLR